MRRFFRAALQGAEDLFVRYPDLMVTATGLSFIILILWLVWLMRG